MGGGVGNGCSKSERPQEISQDKDSLGKKAEKQGPDRLAEEVGAAIWRKIGRVGHQKGLRTVSRIGKTVATDKV